jgi:hypothetical protein
VTGPRFVIRRARKCRWPKCCGLCGAPVIIGTREVLIEPPDGCGPCWWCHRDCALADIKTSADSTAAAPTKED